MTPVPSSAPPKWDDSELDQFRKGAIQAFIDERATEGDSRYRAVFAGNVQAVGALFAATQDLRSLRGGEAFAAYPRLLGPARYLGGPPLSADDLNTLSGATITKRKRVSEDDARRFAEIIWDWLDRERFPWLFDPSSRAPTAEERETAVRWTAGLMTVQQVQTARRNEAATRQQDEVRRLLRQLHFTEMPARPINLVVDLPPGHFCVRDTDVVGTKCDVPIGLRNGRLLLVECKVSNSSINSVKRLNREVGNKESRWRRAFGMQAYTAAVLAGVFKLKNLRDAQDAGISLFWEHDLSPLAAFLEAAV